MCEEAVLVDLLHGCCATCTGASLREEPTENSHVFLLRGKRGQGGGGGGFPDASPPLACRSLRVLDAVTTAERLYRFKQTLDQLELSSAAVLTSPRGRDLLLSYQELLFTPVYAFTYRVACVGGCGSCGSCGDADSSHADSPEGVRQEVAAFLQRLPALRGGVSVLTSSLIPGCFGHGFSTRGGGVSYIPTLSSLNLFSSNRRRDPGAVVMENRRRLALHAGFHPQALILVKVNHANSVWILGKDQPESYDAIVTNRPGVVIAAPGADCIPILFADPVSKVIGVAHAGWRGTLMGVAMATVDAMVTEFGCRVSDVVVVLGPSVGACCFTLEREQALGFPPECVTDPQSTRPHVNIRLANRILLQRGGILPERIHDDTVTDRSCVTPCTSCHPDAFFSHVRDGLNFGTQVGFLWIKEAGEETTTRTDNIKLGT